MDLTGMNFLFGFIIGSPVRVFIGMPPWLEPSELLLGGGVDYMNISARDINDSLWKFPSLTSALAGSGLCSAQIKYCAEWIDASVEEILGMLNCLGKNYTVSDINSAIVLGMYALCHLYWSVAVTMY